MNAAEVALPAAGPSPRRIDSSGAGQDGRQNVLKQLPVTSRQEDESFLAHLRSPPVTLPRILE